MKYFLAYLVLSTLVPSLHSQNMGYDYLQSLGGGDVEVGQSVAVDIHGNIYVTGVFFDTVDFDAGSAVTELISKGREDIFVLKLNSVGSFIWVKQIGGRGVDISEDLKIGRGGNIYITGGFSLEADFDPGPDSLILDAGGQEIFMLKLSSDGDLVWAKKFDSRIGQNKGYEMALDGADNITLTGQFSLENDFDPDTGSYILQADTYGDGFVCRLDSMGTFQWATKFPGLFFNYGESVALDGNGNVLVCGHYEGQLYLYQGQSTPTFSSNGLRNSFIVKLDSLGNVMWAKEVRGDFSNLAFAVRADSQDNVVVSGYFDGLTDFNPGNGGYTMTSLSESDAYVLKLTSGGNFVWAKQFKSTGNARSFDHFIDQNDVIHSAGYFIGTCDFDPGAGQYELKTGTSLNPNRKLPTAYICRLDQNGDFIGAVSMKGDGRSFARSIFIDDSKSEIFITGNYEVSIRTQDSTTFNAKGMDDFFLYRINQFAINLPEQTKEAQFIDIFPNPSTGIYQLEIQVESKLWEFNIYDVHGAVVYSGLIKQARSVIDLEGHSSGIYLLSIKTDKGLMTTRLVKN